MPRIAENSAALLSDLQSRLQRVVEAARREGRTEALAQVRDLVGGGEIPVPFRRGPGRPKGSKNKPKSAAAAGPRKKRRSSWAGLTAEQKLARVNAIRKGRGLPTKDKL